MPISLCHQSIVECTVTNSIVTALASLADGRMSAICVEAPILRLVKRCASVSPLLFLLLFSWFGSYFLLRRYDYFISELLCCGLRVLLNNGANICAYFSVVGLCRVCWFILLLAQSACSFPLTTFDSSRYPSPEEELPSLRFCVCCLALERLDKLSGESPALI